jgi:hypothetical protein
MKEKEKNIYRPFDHCCFYLTAGVSLLLSSDGLLCLLRNRGIREVRRKGGRGPPPIIAQYPLFAFFFFFFLSFDRR